MNLSERTLHDYIRHTFGQVDKPALDLLKRVFSVHEQGRIEVHLSVLAGEKLVVVCKRPEKLRKVILIAKEDPEHVRHMRLTLKGKKNRPKA